MYVVIHVGSSWMWSYTWLWVLAWQVHGCGHVQAWRDLDVIIDMHERRGLSYHAAGWPHGSLHITSADWGCHLQNSAATVGGHHRHD
jgi:hypothetical protein